MYERIGRKKYKIYAFDVESHNDDESIAKNETSIWLYSFIDDTSKIDDEKSYGYDIPSFLNRLEELTNPKRQHGEKKKPIKNIAIYIYNLSFEWSFIFPYIVKDFKYKNKIEKDDEYCYSSVSTKSCSSVWSAELKFKKNGGSVIFRDLCKILPSGLSNVAKSFNLPTQKGEIDYRKNRLHNYVVTQEEKEYCFKDTRIIIDILIAMSNKKDRDFFNSVSAASYACRKMVKYGWRKAHKPMQQFRKLYPELDKNESEFLRHSVAGGITYAPSRWQFKDIKASIKHIDMHQAHPTSAFKNLFPYGKGEFFTGKPNFKGFRINCCHVLVTYSSVKLHSVIKLIGIDIAENFELWLWDFELPLMYKCYCDLKVTYIDGYSYKAKFLKWREYYNDNYKNRAKAKAEKDAFNIMYYKLLNNSSYGKLLERGHDISYKNIINDLGLIDSEILPREKTDINAKYTYLPVGSCIPAYTRVRLVETALLFGWQNVVYFDTDSIFYIETEDNKTTLEKRVNLKDELGGWGIENDIVRAQFCAPKRYKLKEIQDNKIQDVIKMAGFNFKAFDFAPSYEYIDLYAGKYNVQGIRRCRGGTLVILKPKEVKIDKKYIDIYKQNVVK